ncbi:hypothetical protein SBY92_002835 [Candida maltosa Xu316]|uniref:HPP transmembrane region domain-containing protein n=1 Tax=Candida maltosa (strain Xu316) TaxID=1245528 RepID=M3JYA6_CANMX|nr:hypothetical protein G210_2266 [Candida maltosa Xu316]
MPFQFTIDRIFNRYVPKNKLHKLPKPLARLLGAHQEPPTHDYYIWTEILVSTFAGIALLEGLFKSHNVFTDHHHAPMIIASYGATAILCFNASQVPLAQPRNILVGHFIASVIGISIQKLFSLSQGGRDHYWASGALSVAVSSVVMSIGNCVHPPAGASALLPSIDDQIREMSWWFLPVQLVSSVLIIAVACITGNIFRRYPVYWWTPGEVGPPQPQKLDEESTTSIEEESEDNDTLKFVAGVDTIVISADQVIVPEGIDIDPVEVDWLRSLQSKLKKS